VVFECPTPGRLDSCADHTARPDGYLDYFNKPWLEYLGVTLDKVTGWNWTAVVHPEDVEGIVAKWRASSRLEKSSNSNSRPQREWRIPLDVPPESALRDANGNIVKWYGSSLDMKERKQAEEKLRAVNAISLDHRDDPSDGMVGCSGRHCRLLQPALADYTSLLRISRGWMDVTHAGAIIERRMNDLR